MDGNIHSVLKELEGDKEFLRCVSRWERLPAKEGEFADLPGDLSPILVEALKKRGIQKLYSHQAEAYASIRTGNNTVVVTPTASGKTLCYNLPILQNVLENSEKRALYLFPTKALSQDQQSELNEAVLPGELPVRINTYDGDTPSSLRVAARERGQIIISNPDMLHTGILPNHPKWITFLKNLSYVVIDETHSYRGVFGSHMTNVIRRLKRIAAFYGSSPLFVCCSATIGNPLELAERIIESKANLIQTSGAPTGEKQLILYNPPLVDRVQGIRRGVVNESQRLAVRFLSAGIKTIVFARSRVRTELIASYIRNKMANFYTDNQRVRIESYRGGYLPNERRVIERGLRSGEIQGVVSTNALELGIDIGGLDAAILAGFPGSIASSWQQAGRAGRRSTVSVAILVASASPLDQYMVKHPGYFFSQAPESGWIDPDNMYILMDHLKCAVFELPYKNEHIFPEEAGEYLGYLEEEGVVRFTGEGYYWSDRSFPSEQISLRSATSENVVIVDVTKGRNAVIGEMDRPSAKELLFENAVYLHRRNQFIVKSLDIENRRCYVEESTLNYYTDSIVKKDIKVLHEDEQFQESGFRIVAGDVLVRTQVAKFKKIKFQTHENIGYGDISLPEEEMHTRAIALIFASDSVSGKHFALIPEEMKPSFLSRLGSLIRNVCPVYLLCDVRDIGISERIRDPHFELPVLYFYDTYPGGTGIAEGFLRKLSLILEAAKELVTECECSEGCPSCIGPKDEDSILKENPKVLVKRFLEELPKG